MSAPSASGCCRAGVAKVLSTTTMAPRSWASALMASMSTMCSHGLLGVSIHTMRVSGRHAPSTASASVRSTVSTISPAGACTWTARRMVPPYASWGRRAWSPVARSRRSASSAASPDANARPWDAPSSAARCTSSAVRVGLPLRLYS